ncbi:phage tail protein [Acinetobacter pittii]|uniref:phage tail protein n=1 Tax=Acinetobacter pittii TaxID=48296 RepID=UPI001F3930E6|nr:phage tail protein [Acinetobacter pittii]
MATNWNAVLANVNNSADILAILRKVLSLLELKVDGTTIDEVLAQLEKVAADGQITIEEALETLTFLDQKIDERTSAFNDAIEAAAAAGAGANGWTALLVQDGLENQAMINLRLKTMFVFPEHFNDDIVAAAEFAAFNNATLVTKNKTYKLSQEFVLPENLTWLSCFTTIEQVGDALASKTASGLAPRSNVKLTGDLTIDMGIPTTNPWGEKCHVRLDSFNNITPQVRGFYFETLRFKGGHKNITGLAMAGGASLVRGKRIVCDDTDAIARVFMAHWGNFTQHYNDNGTYRHVANYSPTTHPHDCIIDEIVTGNLTCDTNDVSAIVCISAGYDIEIKKVNGNLLDSSQTDKGLIVITPGDLGFAYASSEEKAHKMRRLKIGTVEGKTFAYGVDLIPWALYGANDDTTNVPIPPIYEDYLAQIELDIDYMDVTGDYTRNVSSNLAIGGRTGKGRLNIGVAKATKFYSGLSAKNLGHDITIDELIVTDSKLNPLVIEGSGTTASVLPKNVLIKKLVLRRFGITSTNNAYRTGVTNKLSINCRVDKIVIEEHGNAYCIADTANGALGRDFSIGEIHVNDPLYTQTFLISNTNDVNDPISLDSYSVASGSVSSAIQGGVTKKTNGMFREFYSTPIAVIGLNVKSNDYINLAGVGAGATNRLRVVTAGVYGGTAVLEKIESRPTSLILNVVTVPANSQVKVIDGGTISGLLTSDKLQVTADIPLLGCQIFAEVTATGTFDVWIFNPSSTSKTITPSGRVFLKIV